MKRDTSSVPRKVFRYFGRFLLILLTFLLVLILTLGISVRLICSDLSPSAEKVFVTTMLETGQLKFIPKLFLSDQEIQKLVNSNSLEEFNDPIDSSMIEANVTREGGKEEHNESIEVLHVSGRTYSGTMLILHDPSRLSVGTIPEWGEKGKTLDQIVDICDAIGGINGGLYNSTNNSGGSPYGLVVSNGEIRYCGTYGFEGLVLIGLTEDHILQIVDIDGKSDAEVKQLVSDMKIRDAVVFQEESSDSNNHFVQLVINGKARELNGMGSGLNPRTAIGQRADGSLLLFVTDGRGKNNHLGASASDLIDVMLEYGAVNAANLDGGSSSCMFYDGEYLQDSVTFYYTNSSWRMPCAFVIR